MALPADGWNRYCPCTIQGTEVTGSPTQFVAKLWWDGIVGNSNLPQEMFDADGSYPCQSDGGDIRVTSDEAGTTLLPIHIRMISTDNNPANADAEIALGLNLTGSDQIVYVWYNAGGSKTQPAESAAGGSQDVYDACLYANPMDETGTPAYFDDWSANQNDADYYGGLPDRRTGVETTYKQDFDGAGDYLDFDTNPLSVSAQGIMTFAAFVTPGVTSGWMPIFSAEGDTNDGDFSFWIDNEFSEIGLYVIGNEPEEPVETCTCAEGTEIHIAVRYNNSTEQVEFYRNGVSLGATTAWTTMYALRFQEACKVFQDPWVDECHADLDELMIMDVSKGDNYWDAYYTSWSDPNTFISVGTPESPAAGGVELEHDTYRGTRRGITRGVQ